MKILLDFLPILLFFVAYKMHGIYAGTAVLMGATVVQMAILYAIDKKLTTMHKATLALGVALWAFRKNFLKILLGSQLSLSDPVWNRLTVAWVGYCLFMAALNGYIAAYFSTDAWANFKLWGYVFPLAFILGQGIYVARHLRDDEPEVDPSPGEST